MDPAASGRVPVHILHAKPGEFHARDLPFAGGIEMWVCTATQPAVVLGSRQSPDLINPVAAARRGIEVVHRRSGGTLVHVQPGEVLWVDVVVPAGHPRLRADLPASMMWMGERWCAALAAVGVAGGLDVHRGPLLESAWGELLCFGGLGAGEVCRDGAKLVGISQRRTRGGARFQMAVHRRFDVEDLAGLWAVPTPHPADCLPVAVLCDTVADAELLAALAAELAV